MKIGPKCRDQKCIFAYNLWTFLFSLFGVSWVMPKQVVNLPTCWNRAVGCCQIAVVWGWFGCVSCGLFGENRTILELKQFFLLSLFDWIILSLLDFSTWLVYPWEHFVLFLFSFNKVLFTYKQQTKP